MTPAELIKETFDYYNEDPSRRGKEIHSCRYRTNDGKMCAVGRCFHADVNQSIKAFIGSCSTLDRYLEDNGLSFDSVMQEKYKYFDLDLWEDLQALHDYGENWGKTKATAKGYARYEQLLLKWQ